MKGGEEICLYEKDRENKGFALCDEQDDNERTIIRALKMKTQNRMFAFELD